MEGSTTFYPHLPREIDDEHWLVGGNFDRPVAELTLGASRALEQQQLRALRWRGGL